MPELPDVDVYIEAIDQRVRGHKLEALRIFSPFLLRTVTPAVSELVGNPVVDVRRIGKRVALGLAPDYWVILHLMVAGRLHWQATAPSAGGRNRLAAFDFDNGSLLLTEAGHKKRASLHVLRGDAARDAHDPGGLEPLECSFEAFSERLGLENRTLKRALTSPALFSGIGNAYSDEILHAARLSPIALTGRLGDDEKRRLYNATRSVLTRWRDKLRQDCGDGFPEQVTAFRAGMSVHGRFGKPCPDCASPVQRIRYKSNETNYCARCQTGGRVLADRSLSRLLKDNWPTGLD